jgi:hypothetical protein
MQLVSQYIFTQLLFCGFYLSMCVTERNGHKTRIATNVKLTVKPNESLCFFHDIPWANNRTHKEIDDSRNYDDSQEVLCLEQNIITYNISSSKVCPLYSGFTSPKTKFRHLSLSLVSSSVGAWFVMLRLTPSIHLSLGLPLLRFPSGSHSKIFSGSLFHGILFTCPNHRSRFSSITKCYRK